MIWPKWRSNPVPGSGWSRRAFLGGAAAVVSLPWLESLAPRRAMADAVPPVRLAFWFCPNGFRMEHFVPASTGFGWTPPPILAGLGDMVGQTSVLSGLSNNAAVEFATGGHPRGTAGFLSASRIAIDRVEADLTVDQLAAQLLGRATPFPSLQLKLADRATVCDPGYSCVYNETISWANATTPLPGMTSPTVVFDRLFGGTQPGLSAEARARRAALQTSILDYVTAEASSLSGRLSTSDRSRLDSYLTSVRELELRVQTEPTQACEAPDRPAATFDTDAQIDALTDLMAIAMQCDLSRFFTFMMGNGGSPRDMAFMGVQGQHHATSHHQNDPVMLDNLTAIGAWEMRAYAAFLRKLAAVPEGDGTLLDHSLVLLGSELSDGNAHSHVDLPILLAGSGGGAVVPGQHIAWHGDPVADLYIALLQVVGVPTAAFGMDGTRPLPGLLA